MQLYLKADFSLSTQASFFLICAGDSAAEGYHPHVMPRPEFACVILIPMCNLLKLLVVTFLYDIHVN